MSEFINRPKGQRVRSSVTQQTWGLLSLDRRNDRPVPPFFFCLHSASLSPRFFRFGEKWEEVKEEVGLVRLLVALVGSLW